jgi:hypothetical protein
VVSANVQAALCEAIRGRERLDRVNANIPDELTWRHEAHCMARALGVGVST